MKKAGVAEAEIISNREIAREVYRLVLRYGSTGETQTVFKNPLPGQFVNVYLRDRSALLPRPLSICLAEEGRITLVYRVVGRGTKELSGYRQGESLRISTPLGNGYNLDDVFRALRGGGPGFPETGHDLPGLPGEAGTDRGGKAIALVAGGLGVPPMVELAKTLRTRLENNEATSGRLIAALGFQDEQFLIEELESYCDEVHVATDSGAAGYRGNVLEMMEAKGIKADYYLSCGPKPMLKALAEYCAGAGKPLQVSLEERMGCGYGACVGCTCGIKEKIPGREAADSRFGAEADAVIRRKKVCADGPVFLGEEVVWDE